MQQSSLYDDLLRKLFSISDILSRRFLCLPPPNHVSSQTFTIHLISSGPSTFAPIVRTLASLCSLLLCATNSLKQAAALTPGTSCKRSMMQLLLRQSSCHAKLPLSPQPAQRHKHNRGNRRPLPNSSLYPACGIQALQVFLQHLFRLETAMVAADND